MQNRLPIAPRQFGTRIDRVRHARHRLQTRDLVLGPPLAVNARTLTLLAQLHATAIDEHGRQGMLRILAFGVPAMMREVVDDRIAFGQEFAPDLFGNPRHGPRTDRLFDPEFGDRGRDRERLDPGGGLGELALEFGTRVTLIQVQLRTLREKNRAGKRRNEPRAHRNRPARRGCGPRVSCE